MCAVCVCDCVCTVCVCVCVCKREQVRRVSIGQLPPSTIAAVTLAAPKQQQIYHNQQVYKTHTYA